MTDKAAQARAHEVFDPIASVYLQKDGVTIGPMFGSEGLRIRDKIFALVDYDGELMLKLPEGRVDELVADGAVERVTMAGRTMRKWATVSQGRDDLWEDLVGEAYAYLDEITP